MKCFKRAVRIALVTVLTFMMAAIASAAEASPIGLTSVDGDSNQSEFVVSAVTNDAVTDGVIEITYDSSVLKATAVVVNDDYVTMSSINRDEDGVVKFSWIAGEKSAVKAGEKVVSVTFTGDVKNAKTISVTGQAYVGSEKKAQAVEDTVKVETSESTEETTTESAAESTTESSEETTTSAEEGTTGSETETTESAAEGTDGSVTETTESAEGTTAAVESGSEEDETTSAVSNGSQNSSNGGNNTTTGNTAGNTANGSTNVKTGDETNAGWYMALLVVAALGIAGYFAVQRKRRNEK